MFELSNRNVRHMANHKNDHSHEQITTVAVRAEIDKALSESSLPANKRKEVVAKVEQIVERYSSPYPDPRYLEQIEKLSPGATKEIIDCAVSDIRHRQKIDETNALIKKDEIALVRHIASIEISSNRQGRILGFLAYISCLIFSGTMYYLGSIELALAGFGAAALGIISQIIRGGVRQFVSVKAEVKEPEKNNASSLQRR